MAKLITQRGVLDIADECLQIHGGYGYMREYGIERAVRDARLGPIGGGTDEIMKEILGKQLGCSYSRRPSPSLRRRRSCSSLAPRGRGRRAGPGGRRRVRRTRPCPTACRPLGFDPGDLPACRRASRSSLAP